MNRYFSFFVTLSIFYLINQPDLVFTSSGGNYGSSGASKLNLGVWIPPMTLRLPKFNMPKIKISATIKPRKNQPPMKIHLPEMSLNAKALGDDDNYGGNGGYSSGGGSSYSSGGGGNSYGGGDSGGYSSGGGSYSSGGDSGYSSGGGSSYSSGGDSYGPGNSYGGGNTYNDYGSSSSGGYRASASNQPTNYQANSSPQQSSNDYQQPNYNQMNNNDYSNRYQQQDQRNAYYVDNQQPQQQQISRYQPESVSYGASNSIQSNIQTSTQSNYNRQPIERTYRSTSSGVMPLSNYAKREKGASAYGYGVNAGYSARYGTRV